MRTYRPADTTKLIGAFLQRFVAIMPAARVRNFTAEKYSAKNVTHVSNIEFMDETSSLYAFLHYAEF
jgi:hypothetical protein